MKLTQKQLYWIGGAALALLAIWLFWSDIKALWAKAAPMATGAIDFSAVDRNRILGIGTTGPEVGLLQTYLIRDGATLPKYGIDNKFGAETLAALQSIKGVDEITLNQYEATKPAATARS